MKEKKISTSIKKRVGTHDSILRNLMSDLLVHRLNKRLNVQVSVKHQLQMNLNASQMYPGWHTKPTSPFIVNHCLLWIRIVALLYFEISIIQSRVTNSIFLVPVSLTYCFIWWSFFIVLQFLSFLMNIMCHLSSVTSVLSCCSPFSCLFLFLLVVKHWSWIQVCVPYVLSLVWSSPCVTVFYCVSICLPNVRFFL